MIKIVDSSLFSKKAAFLLLAVVAGCGSSSAASSDGGGGGAGGGTGSGGTAGHRSDAAVGTPGTPVNLATAGNYVILAESAISTVPPAVVTGNLGISPMAATFITQFSLIADSTNVFSTSAQVTGKIYAADYAAAPTPSNLTTAVGDMQTAFTDAAGRAPDFTEVGAGNIGGMTLAPGVYQWGTAVLIPTDLYAERERWRRDRPRLDLSDRAESPDLEQRCPGPSDRWRPGKERLPGRSPAAWTSARPRSIEGVVLCQTMINLRTGDSIAGRLLAQTAVTLDTSTVVEPAP